MKFILSIILVFATAFVTTGQPISRQEKKDILDSALKQFSKHYHFRKLM